MPFALKRLQVDVGNTPHFDIVQRKPSLKAHRARLVLKISPTYIYRVPVKSYAEFSAATSLCKFDINISKIDPLFEISRRLFRPQTYLDWVSPITQTGN